MRAPLKIVLAAAAVVSLTGCGAPPASRPSAPASGRTASPSPIAGSPATPASASSTVRARPHATAMAKAPSSGVVIRIIAARVRWNVRTIHAPPRMSWRLEMENRDGRPEIHNFAIVDGPAVADRIYVSPNTVGPVTETYEIPGLPAGSYEFVCTLHPVVMRGTLVLR